MNFTYQQYGRMIDLLKSKGYAISSYLNYKDNEKCVILRHDVDNDPEKALELAKYENAVGVKSTFFVLLTSPFYNVFSYETNKIIRKIASLGHDIGLHFDELNYTEDSYSVCGGGYRT